MIFRFEIGWVESSLIVLVWCFLVKDCIVMVGIKNRKIMGVRLKSWLSVVKLYCSKLVWGNINSVKFIKIRKIFIIK